jgi:type IV secretory pathway VirB4 component
MLVAIEAVKSKLKYNQKNDKATWVYVDEVHEMWKDEYAIAALEDLWREVRKQGGLCTGMTQFIMDGLGNDSTASMIGNSEFTLLLEQGTIDKANLFEIFEVSNAQLKYVNGVEPGTGLIRFGKKIIPFDNVMEKGSKLYELFNTSFHEDEAGELSG